MSINSRFVKVQNIFIPADVITDHLNVAIPFKVIPMECYQMVHRIDERCL